MTSIVPTDVLDSPGPVALFGQATPLPGQEQALRQTLAGFVTPTRAEDGAVAYFLHEDPVRPGALFFYEHWTSGAALRAHLALPAMAAFAERRHELLDGDLEIEFFTPVEPTEPE